MSKREPAYRLKTHSPRYGERIWLVIQPDGIALGGSFDGPDDARKFAHELNRAYALGRKNEVMRKYKQRYHVSDAPLKKGCFRMVVGPNEKVPHILCNDPLEARAVAEELNRAYELGRKSAPKKPAKGRKE